MYKLDTKNDEFYFILYKDNQKYFTFSKRGNTLEKVINNLKAQGYNFEIF